MTRQVGNELDEFVTGALRNRLLGLPLDLATLNIARARDTGIPEPQRGTARLLRGERQPRPGAVHQLGGLRLQPPERAFAGELHRRLRHAPRRSRQPSAQPRSEPQRRTCWTLRPTACPQARTRTTSSTPPVSTHHRRAASPRPVSTRSTCGWAVSPRSRWCSAGSSARRSTTSSRTRWRTCRTVTGSTTCPAPPVSTCSPSSRATRSPS